MTTNIKRSWLAAVAACSLVFLCGAVGGTAAAAQPDKYQPDMVAALARTLGISEQAAIARLDHESDQQRRLAELTGRGVRIDGAFFDASGNLTVNATDAQAASSARAAGLNVRQGARGESALRRIQADLDKLAARKTPSGVNSWGVDVAADVVRVKVSDASRPEAKAFLAEAARHGKAVVVEQANKPLVAQMEVYPGSEMTINNTSNWCSVGYGATSSSGVEYLVTAGHCISRGTTLRLDGTRFAVGSYSRYQLGSDSSVDMGIARVDTEDSIARQVGTWGALDQDQLIRGSRQAAVGSTLCKSGATTGWTCGTVRAYDLTVTYIDLNGGPDTVIHGLASSTVCTEGGDSGSAYIAGDQAQGMTSGGPVGQTCQFNGGHQSGKSSYFQPLNDVLSYYGLTLNLS